jgi:hypothetical protein
MAKRLLGTIGVMIMLGLLASGCAGDGTMGVATSDSGAAPASIRNIDRIASGAVEDTLSACLARIPKDATSGQRMLAEESCRRDQAARR